MNIYSEYMLKTYSEKVNKIYHLSYIRGINMYIAQKVQINYSLLKDLISKI